MSEGLRTPAEIRRSIEQTRGELVSSVDDLRGQIDRITDWRRQISDHRQAAVTSAAVAGFIVGGGLAIFRLRRRR